MLLLLLGATMMLNPKRRNPWMYLMSSPISVGFKSSGYICYMCVRGGDDMVTMCPYLYTGLRARPYVHIAVHLRRSHRGHVHCEHETRAEPGE